MTMRTTVQGQNQTSPGLRFKEFNSLSSTLNYSLTSSPALLKNSSTDMKINLSRFNNINITDKVKKKLTFHGQTKRKRNQSLGSMLIKDTINPQSYCLTSRQNHINDKNEQMSFLNANIEEFQQKKKLFNKLVSQPIGSSISSSPKLLELSLPAIDTVRRKKKHNSNKANFMQLWLDEALDPQQLTNSSKQLNQLSPQFLLNQLSPSTHNPVIQSQLSTVRKYKIDRQYLRSQNVSKQIIDRLYNSLYIYTYGIQKVFDQILVVNNVMEEEQRGLREQDESESGSKDKVDVDNDNNHHNSNNNNSNQNNDKLLDIFWKSYIKLLQNCTSFQTVFQKIQQHHLQQISQLKLSILKHQQEFTSQKSALSYQIKQLQKQLLQLQTTYNKLQSDQKITASTLQLTDIALNEQVQLRLKFEQKINYVYSSYQQLKVKYSCAVQQLNLKIKQQMSRRLQQRQQKEHARRLQIQLQQLKHLLSQQKKKVSQRQQQITIKKQQLIDMQSKLQHHLSISYQSQDFSNQQLSQLKLLSTKHQQSINNFSLLQYQYKLSQQKIIQLTTAIECQKNVYDQLHQKYAIAIKTVGESEYNRIRQQQRIIQLQEELNLIKQKLTSLQQKDKFLTNQLQLVTKQLQQKNFLLQTKSQTQQKITQTIEHLKSTKIKYETLFKIISQQKNALQQQKNKISTKHELQTQQIVGLKMLNQNREKQIKQMSVKHEKEREALKRKLAGFNEVVGKKESMIMEYEKGRQQAVKIAMSLKQKLVVRQNQIKQERINTERIQKEKVFLQKMLADSQQQVANVNKQLRQHRSCLGQSIRQLSTKQQQIQSANSLLSQLQAQRHSSNANLSTLYNEYRLMFEKKSQYMHPMVYEDLVGQLNRAKLEQMPGLLREINCRKQVQARLKGEIAKMNSHLKERDDIIANLNLTIKEMQSQLTKQQHLSNNLNQTIITLKQTISQNSYHHSTLTTTITQHQQTISTLTSQHSALTSQLSQTQSMLSLKQQQLVKLNVTVNILSDKLIFAQHQLATKQKGNVYVGRIEKLQLEINHLKEELRKYQQIKALRQSRQVQTEPQGEVIVIGNRSGNNNTQFSHRNKFVNEKSSQPITTTSPSNNSKQTQVSFPPYNNIPIYTDIKLTSIRNQFLDNEQSITLQSKIYSQKIQKSIEKVDNNNPKQSLKRRQDLRKALRFTYMRR